MERTEFLEKFPKVATDACRAGIIEIRKDIFGRTPALTEMKADETAVTATDLKSEETMVRILRQGLPKIPIVSEERVKEDICNAPLSLWVDSLDGTSARRLEIGTSTTIVTAYDLDAGKLIATAIADMHGRVWTAVEGQQTLYQRFDPDNLGAQTPLNQRPCQVWDGKLNRKSTVFFDVSHGFARDDGKRVILSEECTRMAQATIQKRAKVLIPGSNGLTHALVANGGEGAAGAITFAMGGEWDVAGMLLVRQAGGCLIALKATGPDLLEKVNDPLDPLSYDIAISANNDQTLTTLYERLTDTVYDLFA